MSFCSILRRDHPGIVILWGIECVAALVYYVVVWWRGDDRWGDRNDAGVPAAGRPYRVEPAPGLHRRRAPLAAFATAFSSFLLGSLSIAWALVLFVDDESQERMVDVLRFAFYVLPAMILATTGLLCLSIGSGLLSRRPVVLRIRGAAIGWSLLLPLVHRFLHLPVSAHFIDQRPEISWSGILPLIGFVHVFTAWSLARAVDGPGYTALLRPFSSTLMRGVVRSLAIGIVAIVCTYLVEAAERRWDLSGRRGEYDAARDRDRP